MTSRILVTSALPYANGPIHLGHLVEYIQTDIWVRYHKLRQRHCVYVCADDTHGTPVMIRAQREGVTPVELVNRMHQEHVADFTAFHIAFDNYFSTNSEENRLLSQEIYQKNRQAGHIQVKNVRQAYCIHDNMFLPDRFIRGMCPSCKALDQYGDACELCGTTYAPTDLIEARCALCNHPPEERESEHYFFQLNHFETFLKEWCQSESVQPEMSHKLDEWFKEGLKDWDISRDGPYFGFEIPDAPGKYFYVWLDAPVGYMASTLNWCQRTGEDFDLYWRSSDHSEVYHFIGKDIVYFHTLFWPAMLHGAGFRTPTAIFAHGFLTINGQKMSKSRGTFINARTYLKFLSPEYLRYYYATKLTSRVDDIDLNFEDFAFRVNSDLVGKVVNLASRTAGFLHKFFAGVLSTPYPTDGGLFETFVQTSEEIAHFYQEREFNKAMRSIMTLADQANRYIEQQAPWVLAKQSDGEARLKLHETCSVALNLFRLLILYLKPVMPELAKQTEIFMNLAPMVWADGATPLRGHQVGVYQHLCQRVDPKQIELLLNEAKEEMAPLKSPPKELESSAIPIDQAAEIGMEEFSRVDIRVARILSANSVPGADKLLDLVLDVGNLGQRRVFAGIKVAYDPALLAGRLVAAVVNLKPRKMKFGVSEGMVLAAGPGGSDLFLLSPDSGAKPGMQIK
ncbi:MAG: methionine--tRNA ligase [Magnetococcus sp. DMHC-6]